MALTKTENRIIEILSPRKDLDPGGMAGLIIMLDTEQQLQEFVEYLESHPNATDSQISYKVMIIGNYDITEFEEAMKAHNEEYLS